MTRDAILAYTDGACSGNPGPAGIGVVLVSGVHRRELSEYIGEATSNIAELSAVVRALESIKDQSRPVILHSDSKYTIGMLANGWKAKANQALIERARGLAAAFPRLRFEWVPGHAGVAENERCDQLARAAIRERRTAPEVTIE
jgi:ribonuclease HI